jgi:hypothetical protein
MKKKHLFKKIKKIAQNLEWWFCAMTQLIPVFLKNKEKFETQIIDLTWLTNLQFNNVIKNNNK